MQYRLEEVEHDCWCRIQKGALVPADAFHTPVVATVREGGVSMRTVVLRNADTVKKKLVFYTDIRSGKWRDLQEHSTTSWLLYTAQDLVQIRLEGNVTLHTDDLIADQAWQHCTMSGRKNYLTTEGPSKIVEAPVSGLPEQFDKANPTLAESEAGRKNFGVVITTIQWMEWLWLSKDGHRRASFTYHTDNSFDGCWLIP